jgi:D-glycero-D-manno-heptose 1,7-bisphosphate phosphatase
MKSGVFFERDGILNLVQVEKGSQVTPLTLDAFQINAAALEPLRRLKAAGFVLLATTNQPGLSRGYQSRRELDRMHDQLRRQLPLDDILVCPHDETDDCPCRRPQPGLLTEGAFTWHLDLERSFVVSDKWHDAQAAHLAGCSSLLLRSPWIGKGHHDFVLSSLSAVADKIFQLQSAPMLLMHQA